MGRLSSIVAQFINGELEKSSIAMLFFFTAISMVVGSIVSCCLPVEPKGRSLQSIDSEQEYGQGSMELHGDRSNHGALSASATLELACRADERELDSSSTGLTKF